MSNVKPLSILRACRAPHFLKMFYQQIPQKQKAIKYKLNHEPVDCVPSSCNTLLFNKTKHQPTRMSPLSEHVYWSGAAQCIVGLVGFLTFELKTIPFSKFKNIYDFTAQTAHFYCKACLSSGEILYILYMIYALMSGHS